MIVFGGGPTKYLFDVLSEYVERKSMLVDKMGEIINNGYGGALYIYTPELMTSNKLGNMHVYDGGDGVLRFNKNSTLCTNNLH
jgi:hypothetical protein